MSGMDLQNIWRPLTTDAKPEKPVIKTIKAVLECELDWGAVALAIESTTLYGWDRFERWGAYRLGDQPVNDALDEMAYIISLESQSVGGEDEPPFFRRDPIEDNLVRKVNLVGWRLDEVPDFSKFKSLGPSKPLLNKRPSKKAQSNELVLIGFLLKLLTGELEGTQHPKFSKDSSIIKYAETELKNVSGLSKRQLESKFSDARNEWKNREIS